MLRTVKKFAYSTLRYSNISRAVSCTAWRKNRLLILCYHGISLDDEHECSDLYVTPGHLRRRFELLRLYGCNVLPLDRALALQRDGNLPEKAVSITFDDGMYDFVLQAYPLLLLYEYPAMLYLTTYYCFRETPVFDTMLNYLMWKGRAKLVDFGKVNFPEKILLPITQNLRFDLHKKIRAYATQHLHETEKQSLLSSLAEQVGVDYSAITAQRFFQIMNPSEVKSMDRQLLDVQLHTHRHRTPNDEDEFKREIADNANAIKRILNDPTWRGQHFCYPSGEYRKAYISWLKDIGIQYATTCDPGLVSGTSSNYLLPRFIDTMNTSETAFIVWLSGAGVWLPRNKTASERES